MTKDRFINAMLDATTLSSVPLSSEQQKQNDSEAPPPEVEVEAPIEVEVLPLPLEGEHIPAAEPDSIREFVSHDITPEDAAVVDVEAARQDLQDEAEAADEYVPTPEEIAAEENAALPIQPITIVFNGTGLGIFVGRVLLEYAAINGPYFNQMGRPALVVRRGDVFTKDVGRELLKADEEGATLLTRALDEAIVRAVQNGSEGVVVGDTIMPPDDPNVSILLKH